MLTIYSEIVFVYSFEEKDVHIELRKIADVIVVSLIVLVYTYP